MHDELDDGRATRSALRNRHLLVHRHRGFDDDAFADAWEQGQTLTADEAIALALTPWTDAIARSASLADGSLAVATACRTTLDHARELYRRKCATAGEDIVDRQTAALSLG